MAVRIFKNILKYDEKYKLPSKMSADTLSHTSADASADVPAELSYQNYTLEVDTNIKHLVLTLFFKIG